jgi:hypothetical protein
VDYFKKDSNDEKVLEQMFGKATSFGSEVCDILCLTKLYSILAANGEYLEELSAECLRKFIKSLMLDFVVQ